MRERVLSGPCAKCSYDASESWLGGIPGRYGIGGGGGQRIFSTCPYCGYTWTKPCADASEEESGG